MHPEETCIEEVRAALGLVGKSDGIDELVVRALAREIGKRTRGRRAAKHAARDLAPDHVSAAWRLSAALLRGEAVAGVLPWGTRLVSWRLGQISFDRDQPSREVDPRRELLDGMRGDAPDLLSELRRLLPPGEGYVPARFEDIRLVDGRTMLRLRRQHWGEAVVDVAIPGDAVWALGGEAEAHARRLASRVLALPAHAGELGRLGRAAIAQAEWFATNACAEEPLQIGRAVADMDDLEGGVEAVGVEVLSLDHGLRPQAVTLPVAPDPGTLTHALTGLLVGVRGRTERFRAARANGGQGTIDELALKAVDASVQRREGALRALDTELGIDLRSRRRGVRHASVFWHEGCIELSATFGRNATWGVGGLTIKGCIPDAAVAALPGRRLGDLLELPFGSIGLRVGGVRREGALLRVEVERPEHVVDCERGRVLD